MILLQPVTKFKQVLTMEVRIDQYMKTSLVYVCVSDFPIQIALPRSTYGNWEASKLLLTLLLLDNCYYYHQTETFTRHFRDMTLYLRKYVKGCKNTNADSCFHSTSLAFIRVTEGQQVPFIW